VSYTAVIDAWAKAHRPDEPEKYFEIMVSDGVIPNVLSYSAVIDAWSRV